MECDKNKVGEGREGKSISLKLSMNSKTNSLIQSREEKKIT
jgi:hypothetical protein